jgi:hypothetical protein
MFTAQVLRYLLPDRSDRIAVFGDLQLEAPAVETLVLSDPPFVQHSLAHGPPVPDAVRLPPSHWQRVAEFRRAGRPSVRGALVGLFGIRRTTSTGDAQPATLWLVRPVAPATGSR